MRIAWFLVAASMAAVAAEPAAVSDRELRLTIYNNDLALVEHLRPLSVAKGRQRLEFPGVSARIIPQTVSFGSAQLTLLEQNFDYDLLTPAKLMQKAVGSKVRITRTNPATGAETTEVAEVLSVTEGIVLRIGERIEVLRDDGLPARVVFDRIPDNLRARPTLSVLVDAREAVNENVRLAYLTRGLSWTADYVAVFDEGRGETDLQGWITLRNSSGTSYPDARVQLVAGDVNLSDSEQVWWQRYSQRRSAQRSAGTEPGAGPRLGDYYIYPVDGATTVANQQTKQLSLLSADHVKSSKGYELTYYGFRSQDGSDSAEVRVRFSNSQAGGLGVQLPSGVVRVYARDSQGQPQFIGEDRIGHSSAGSDVALRIGDSFDVTVQPTLVATRRSGPREEEVDMSYRVRNARPEPVVVTLRQGGLWRENEIRSESIKGRRNGSDSVAWDVSVPANGEATLTFTLHQSW